MFGGMAWVKTGLAGAVGLVAGVWLAGQWLGEEAGSGLAGFGASALGVAVPQPGAGAAIVGTARVIDGDTLRLGGTRIRIQGIDAPETDDVCRRPDGSRWRCGDWSTEVARDLFEGRHMVCHDLGERSYDRVVARCMLGETDFAEAMLAAGAARACERFARRHPHSLGYMALEAAAADARRGIFDGTPPPRAGFCLPRNAQAGGADTGAPQTSTPQTGTPGTIAWNPAPDPDRRLAAAGCTIKGNISQTSGERIYHLPGQAHYDSVIIRPELGQRWFCSEEEAQAAGWRPALR